jgi:hypothetical protein
MKAVLAAVIDGEKKLYYVLDSKDKNSDGVLVNEDKPKLVNFWRTATRANNLVPLRSTKFHDYLWDGASSEDKEVWERIFIKKTQDIDNPMTSGLTISTDVMKSKPKEKSLNARAMEFKTLMQTQNINMVRNKAGKQ